MSIRHSGFLLRSTVQGCTGISVALLFFMRMQMMLSRILLSMPGKISVISEVKVLFTPGSMPLQPTKRNETVPLDDVRSILANSAEGYTWFDGDEAQVKLQNAILQLPEKQRIVFNLKYFDEMTYEDMSKVLKTSEGALKASFHHAVKKIEKILGGD
jgi:RNA polymerase sigma factor (sigma-70 family)